MHESLFLAGLTLTLVAGAYVLKSVIHTSHYLIKGIFEFFEEKMKKVE